MAFLWPLFTKYFVRAIRLYQDRPNLLKLQRRLQKYYIEKAKARAGALTHELVLYGFLWPLYDFTKYFVRAIRFYQDRPNLLKLQKAITEILH